MVKLHDELVVMLITCGIISFRQGWSSVTSAEGDKKGSSEAPSLSI